MKLTHMLASAAIVVSMPGFALAAAHEMDTSKMTCAEFTAMDDESKMKAVDDMHMAAMDAENSEMSEEEKMKTEEDKMAKEADMSKEDKMKMDEEKMAMNEEGAMKTAAACEGNDDMMAIDAMKSDS
ncbi:HdeA/HdeB family chaperone [Oceaniovalibus sp. ACAM 378]|uniref:HdeA/HdeB family chaperone n=1 Tax=Oceaniovalibus sp. ACAM 378 TaxID=2599923 RepID=UPI0011D8A36D|nr:HdeA/HdeB family chaperone [Oceaniovalibus sp. ACAM 378]TYB83636.1 hypothetical protein FQ320_24505 [Oceaniovalibus sp. ACAM 378]